MLIQNGINSQFSTCTFTACVWNSVTMHLHVGLCIKWYLQKLNDETAVFTSSSADFIDSCQISCTIFDTAGPTVKVQMQHKTKHIHVHVYVPLTFYDNSERERGGCFRVRCSPTVLSPACLQSALTTSSSPPTNSVSTCYKHLLSPSSPSHWCCRTVHCVCSDAAGEA